MRNSWIHLARGQVAWQVHRAVPEGLKEEEISRLGFQGRVANLYRRNEPVAYVRSEGEQFPGDIDGNAVECSDRTDPLGRGVVMWRNDDLTVIVSRRSQAPSFWARNTDGDDLWFVHRGEGVLETEFGPIPFRAGDYMLVPKGVTQRLVPSTDDNFFLLLQSRGEVSFADHVMLGRHVPVDPAMVFVPEPYEHPSQPGREYELRVRRDGQVTSYFQNTHPLDVVGWKGDLFPLRFHNLDFVPVVADRGHVPPTASALFQAEGWVLCNFVPGPMQRDRAADRLPYYHRNVDYDEIGFLHQGCIAGVPMQSATFMWHPRGSVHGPGEEMRKTSDAHWQEYEMNDVQAVNIDTLRPLTMSDEARALLRSEGQLAGKRS